MYLQRTRGPEELTVTKKKVADRLVAPDVVDTVPSATLEALHDHGRIRPDTIRRTYARSRKTLNELARIGVALDELTTELERVGIDAFGESWGRLVAAVRD